MKYSAIHKKLLIEHTDLERASVHFLWALKKIRLMAGLPLTRYKQKGMLTDADHAQRAIIEAAKEIGIDLGAMWGSDIDLTSID